MKKFILFMLIISLIAMPVLSCATTDGGAGEQNQNQNDPAREPETPLNGEPGEETAVAEELRFPELPNVDFGGYEFRILNTSDDHVQWLLKTLVAETETGEPLNDAIFRRNRRMEERFGFNLIQIDTTGPGQVRDRLRTSVQAGSHDFDLGMMESEQALGLAQTGLLERIDTIPHIDLSAPWWDQDMVRDFSIGHRLFLAASDFTFNHYSATIAIMFNKELHADLGLDCPYMLVHEGRWTLDRFAEQARAGMRDLNGDGIFDQHDQWGYLALATVYAISILNGIGTRYVIKDADDLPVLNLNTDGFISRFHTAFDLLTEGWLFDGANWPVGEGGVAQQAMFLNNQGLFWTELIHRAVPLRAMDADFGILPHPKLNEQQESYISGVGRPHVMAIPVTTDDLDRTGIIIEALSAESRLSTLEVYFDTMLVNQIMNRDEESAEMLDIIFGNRVYELGRQYWTANIANHIHEALRNNNRDIVSIIERIEPAAEAAIQRTIDAFLDD